MHFLTNVIGCIGELGTDSGCAEVLSAAFAGVAEMLSGKKYPQNFRALVMLTVELLRPILVPDQAAPSDNMISSMPELEKHLDTLSVQSRTFRTLLAPAELLKVLKCGCCSNTPCNTRRCTCKANGLDCTLFCQCRGEDDCHNKWTIYITMTMFTWICTVIWWNVNRMPIAICLKLSGSKMIWLNL